MGETALLLEHPVLQREEEKGFRHRQSMPAHIIQSDAEALQVASSLAALFKKEAARRDQSGFLSISLVNGYSQSGLWGITVPSVYGGADVSHVTLSDVIAIVAAADPSLAQIPQNHFNDVDTIRWAGDERQCRFFFAEALFGARFGNAFAELGNKDASGFQTRLTKKGDSLCLNGRKFYATGALMANWVQVGAIDEDGRNVLAFVRRDAAGLTVIDDWSGFGQRTTASGTVVLEDVQVEAQHVIRAHRAFDQPTTNGPLSQLLHSAIDLGIGRAAIADTIELLRSQNADCSGYVDPSIDESMIVQQVGELMFRLHAAEALQRRGAIAVDDAAQTPTAQSAAAASVAVAEAKIATTELSLFATNKLFELAGPDAADEKLSFDRHWRNARTHTLHDPVRWKYHAIGNYYLNKTAPARKGWL